VHSRVTNKGETNYMGGTGVVKLVVSGYRGREGIIHKTGLVVSNWPNLHGYLV
jgi:hypothetical protein